MMITIPEYPQYVQRARNGNCYLRYKNTPRVKIEGAFDSRESRANYDRLITQAVAAAARADAIHETRAPIKKKSHPGDPLTIDAAVRGFLADTAFQDRVSAGTQLNYARMFRAICRYDAGEGRLGTAPVVSLTREHVKRMIGKVVPARSSKIFIACLRGLMKHCVEELKLFKEEDDPTLGFKLPEKTKRQKAAQKEGLKAWPAEHVAMFRECWAERCEERKALELIRWSGGACIDVMQFGWKNFETDANGNVNLIYKREKTLVQATNPYWPELKAYLEAAYGANWKGPFLRRQPRNAPWATVDNDEFSAWFVRACRKAGLPKGYGAHGLRKFYLTERAEMGASVTDLMAFGGWDDPSMAIHYVRLADQKKAAARALEAEARTRQLA